MNPDPPPPVPPSIPPIPPAADPPLVSAGESAKDNAEKALGMAREGLMGGVASYKTLGRPDQIYLGGLAVALICGVLFDAITIQVKSPALPDGLAGLIPHSATSVSAFDMGAKGKLAILAAAAGIGIWVWNFKSTKKEPWVPKALAGCAGFSALMFLALLFTGGGGNSMVEIDIDMTLFGFWLPFAAAIAATVFSVKKLKQPA